MQSDIDSATEMATPAQAGSSGPLGVSVIIPAFNEAEGVVHVVQAVREALERTGRSFEVLVVDDASTDGTGELARKAGARVLTHSYNLGYGGSLKDGVRDARYPVVLFYDADGQFAAADIEKILSFLPEYDMATGWRDSRSHVPKDRIVGKKFLGWVANWLARQSIPDLNCGFRAIKRRVLMQYLHLLPDGFSASTTTTLLFLKQGHRVKFVPTVIEERVGSSTVRPLHHGMQTVLLIVRLITLLDPFRVFFPASAMMGLMGLGWAIPYLIAGNGLSTGALFLMVTSVMFFFFGLLADQVAAMRREQAAFHWQSIQDDAEHSSED